MKVVIAGQKWLGAEVLGMCRDLGHHVVQAVVPSPDDRLAVAASAAGVPVTVEARRVDTVTPSSPRGPGPPQRWRPLATIPPYFRDIAGEMRWRKRFAAAIR